MKNRNQTGGISGNLFFLLSGGVIASILEFFTEVKLAKSLTDQGFGYWSYVQSIVIYLLLIMDLGLSVYGAREIARFRDKADQLIVNILVIKGTLAVIILVIFFLVVAHLDMTHELKLLYIGGALLLIPQALSPEFIFQGLERMGGIALWRILNFLFYMLLVYILVINRGSLAAVPFYKAGAGMISLVIVWIWLLKFISPPKLRLINVRYWFKWLRISVVMALSFVIINIYQTFDTIMLGILTTPETVGWYNAAYKVIIQFIGLSIIAQVVFGPVFSRQREDKEKLGQTLNYFSILLFTLAGLICGALFLTSNEIVMILFGSSFANAIGILHLLSISLFFVFIYFVFTTPLLYCGYEYLYLTCMVLGAVVNIILNYFMIPVYGYNGAVAATIISNFVIAIAGIVFLRTRMSIPQSVYRLLALVLFITPLFVILARLMFLNEILRGLFYIVLYILVLAVIYHKTILHLMNKFIFIKIEPLKADN